MILMNERASPGMHYTCLNSFIIQNMHQSSVNTVNAATIYCVDGIATCNALLFFK
jgi:hypothetical protein